MITSDTNFRGNYDSIEAVWEAIPYGGVEGDYLNIQGVKYRWNKYLAMWENAEVVTETPARETVTFDEDVNMQNNLTVAGVLRAKKFVVDDLPTGIEDVEITESAVSGGNNVITFTYTNGETQTFNIKNGEAGEAGKTQAAFAVVADALDKTEWDTAKCYLVLTETEGEFDVYSYENEEWNKIDTIEIDLNYDIKQTTGQSTTAVMSQKAVTDVTLLEETLSIGNPQSMIIKDNLQWDGTTYTHYIIAVEQGVKYKVTARASQNAQYAWLKNNNTPVRNTDAPISDIDHAKHTITANTSEIITPPSDSNYLYFLGLVSVNSAPSKVEKLIPVNEAVEVLMGQINIIAEGSLVNASDGVILCTKDIVPAGSLLVYDFSINGGSSTSASCYMRIYKNDDTSEYIGKTSSSSGNVEYAGKYVIPSNYTKITIEGKGGMTVAKISASQLSLQKIIDGASAYDGIKLTGTLFPEPVIVLDKTVIFTSEQYKENDCVHIELTAIDDTGGFISLYDLDGNTYNYGKLSRNYTNNNYSLDIVIPHKFSYAEVNAITVINNVVVSQYLFIDCLYKVPYEHGVFKIGNPMFETLDTFNNKSEVVISTGNVFSSTDGLVNKRIPSVVITNASTVLAISQNKPNREDNSPSGFIIGRKVNGGEWTIDTSTFPYDSSVGSLMNPSFVVDRSGIQGVQGRIYLFALIVTVTQSNEGFAYKCTTNEIAEAFSYSDDDGVTWSSFETIPKTAWDTSSYTWMCNSPSNGIITTDGTMALACMGRVGGANGVWVSGVMYKPANGEWQFSQVSTRQADNESVVFEGIDGGIYLNCRNETFNYLRSLYKLNVTDGSLSTIDNGFNPKVALQCCITKCTIGSDTCYLMTFPDPTSANQRNRITVWASADGIRWTRVLRMTGNAISSGYSMISCYNGKCVMVYENDGWDCRTIGYADLTPALELLRQSSLMCGESADERIHRVTCYEKGISV